MMKKDDARRKPCDAGKTEVYPFEHKNSSRRQTHTCVQSFKLTTAIIVVIVVGE